MAMAVTGDNELLELFTRYNEDLWPVHLVAYAAGVAAVALLFARRRDRADRVIAGLLAALWLWLGVVFQGLYATDVDVVLGTAYAVMFVLQAYLLFRHGVLRGELTFRPRAGLTGAVGWAALAYAVIVYPVIGAVLGHGWPESAAPGDGALSHHHLDVRSAPARHTTGPAAAARGPVRLGGPGASRGDGPGCLRGCRLAHRRDPHGRSRPGARPSAARGTRPGGCAIDQHT